MMTSFQSVKIFCLAVTLATALAGCQNKPLPFHGADIKGAPYGQAWVLTDQTGHTRQAKDFKGHIQLVYFGFTQCPDICPATLQRMQAALDLISPEVQAKHTVDIVFITVDPETDTVSTLSEYLKPFGSHVIGLTGTQEEVDAAAKDFKVYAQQSSKTPKMFEHSGFVYVMDTQGRARLLYAPETSAKDIAEDIHNLIAEGGA